MATRIYGADQGYALESVTEAVGPATTAHAVELNVDLAALVQDGGVARGISRNEVLIIIDLFEQYITRSIWPPA